MDVDRALKVMSKVWGRRSFVKGEEEYWAFLATIRGDATNKVERIGSWSEHAFRWPVDKAKITAFLKSHTDYELYWCPNLFEVDRRHEGAAWDERCLYADLDDVDPRSIDYEPTIAWESSPGRFQAIWMFGSMTALTGASAPGHENQRLTYYLGADKSGWDTTQLLRVPGSANFKPEYRKANKDRPVPGKILWDNRRQWLPEEFTDLPEVQSVGAVELDALEDEIDRIDRHAVWGRVRLRVSKRVRDFVAAREAHGDRSDILWEIERELADAGCTIAEIVAVLRPSVWNKFEGRSDELRRLITEASKAVAERGEGVKDKDSALEEIDDTVERPKPQNIFTLLKNIKQPKWLIRGVLTEGAVGFIAGQPKQYKSWFGLDMALSVASGQPFLSHFDIEQRGPVLYLQEEDAPPLVKQRIGKVWPGKLADKVVLEHGEMFWLPGQEDDQDIDLDAVIMGGFILSDPGWQSWLDEIMTDRGYKLIVMDPLMMMAGDVEENRAQEMTTKVFKPLKELSRKHACAVQVVHHMRKGDPKNPQRGGQMLLGSVANHAWAEDSLYLKFGRGGDVIVEQESKNAPVPGFRVTGIRNRRWEPVVTVNKDGDAEREPDGVDGQVRKPRGARNAHLKGKTTDKSQSVPLKALCERGRANVGAIAADTGVARQSIYSAFDRAIKKGWVTKDGNIFSMTDAGREAIS